MGEDRLYLGFVVEVIHEGVFPITILYKPKTLLERRRSERASQPSSSYTFERFEPCHVPLAIRAALYCSLSTSSISLVNT